MLEGVPAQKPLPPSAGGTQRTQEAESHKLGAFSPSFPGGAQQDSPSPLAV